MKKGVLLLLIVAAIGISLAYMNAANATANARHLQQDPSPTDTIPVPTIELTTSETPPYPQLPYETPYIAIAVTSTVLHTGERFSIASYTNAGMGEIAYRVEPEGLITSTWQACAWYPDALCQTNPWLAVAPGIVSIWASTYGEVCCWYWSGASMTEPLTLTITGPEITLTPTSTPSPTPTSTSTPSHTPTPSPTTAPTHYLTLSASSNNIALGHVFTVEARTDLGLASFGYFIEPSSIITFDLPTQYRCIGGIGNTNCGVVYLRPISPGIALINANAYGEACCWFFTGVGTQGPITITISGTLMWYPLVLR